MADLVQKNNPPSDNKPKNTGGKIAVAVLLAGALFSAVAFFATQSAGALILGALLLVAALIVFVTGVLSFHYTPPAKRYGDRGERVVGSVLERSLPEGYTVIQNAKITYNGHTSETDNIVVGKTGVFIIEVKYMKGDIIGDYCEKNWLQDKIDRYDLEHQKEFYSPVKQIGTHIYRLANFLRDNKVFTHVSGAVYFANPEATVHLSGEPGAIPVYTYRSTKALLNYIMSGDANLSEKTIHRILQLLK